MLTWCYGRHLLQDVIYISTPNRLYRMNPYQCSAHQSCGSCVASMDPYCAYDTALGACVGINSANRNVALQNVTHGVADCPIVGKKIELSNFIG